MGLGVLPDDLYIQFEPGLASAGRRSTISRPGPSRTIGPGALRLHRPRRLSAFAVLFRNGVPEGNRTPDLRFRKPSLYPAELPGRSRSTGCDYRLAYELRLES
jgi:hypothetical protein